MRESLLRLIIFIIVSLVAHRAAEAQHSRVHLSDGGELGVGEVKYDGSSAIRTDDWI